MAQNQLVRRTRDAKIAGVCAGLGDHFSVDPLLFRLGFVLFLLAGGSSIVLYIVLWLLLPARP